MSQCKHVANSPCNDKSGKVIPFPGAQRRPAGIELPPDISIGAIAEFGALTGDPTRIAMLMALLPGEPLTAGDLAAAAGVTAQTASGHLSRLTAGGLLAVTLIGRRRLHRYASAEVQSLIRSLYLGGSHIAKTVPRRRDREAALVVARVCGGHLAGHLGVALAERLIDGLGTTSPRWRDDAAAALAAWALAGAIEADQVTLDCCIDWSEKSAHVAGPLGALLLRHSIALGWLRATPGSSALIVTAAGRQGFHNRFGIAFDDVVLAGQG